MEEIKNKVKDSGLVPIDLANYEPKDKIEIIDLSNQLWQGLVLKEKDFRNWIKTNDWTVYTNKVVLITCSTDAIIPAWAYMLVGSALEEYAKFYCNSSKEELIKQLIISEIQKTDIETIKDARIIVKGCSKIPYPDFAMLELTKFLMPHVKSLMFGEPCSTVPIFKRK
jgi:hypothetical protein